MTSTKFRRLYGLGCVVIAVVSAIVGRQNLGGFVKMPRPSIQKMVQAVLSSGFVPQAQSVRDRVIKNLHLQPLGSFTATLDAPPSRITPSPNGTVFVLDLNDSTVKEYSSLGHILHRYSATGDETPGKITDFAVATDGTVWTDDPNGEVAGIRRDGSVPYHLKGLHAMRLAWINDRLLVQTVPSPVLPLGDKLFVTVSPQGRILGRFGELVQDTAHFGISVIGQPVATTNGNEMVYAAYPAGLLADYDLSGHEKYEVWTIQPLPLPALEITAKGATHLPPIPRDATRDVSVSAGNIFVLSGAPSSESDEASRRAALVDVYNVENGKYRFSFPLPFDSSSFAVSKDLLYASHGNVVYVWMMPEGT